jgi:hypothetical protein
MRRTRLITVVVVVIASLACGKRVPPPQNIAPGTPYITWIIMHGDSDNPDREFACQSTPRNDCALPVSTEAQPVFSHVYLYYHGVGQETTYAGEVQITFFRGGGTGGSRTNITVRRNESITNQSTTGIVTSTPGAYALSIAFEATTSAGTKHQINEEVSVAVR